MINLVEICNSVLNRLSKMDNELEGGDSEEQLIFPQRFQPEEIRISEQELRVLFIEGLKLDCEDLFYSIETPTKKKFKFGESHEEIVENMNVESRSASIDLCVFTKTDNDYNRLLNIEFKHGNGDLKNTSKDILKLIKEGNNGAFIQLLDNTNKRSLINSRHTGVFDKLFQSFTDFKNLWDKEIQIQIIVISLKQKLLVYKQVSKKDIPYLNKLFFQDLEDLKYLKIVDIKNQAGWLTRTLD